MPYVATERLFLTADDRVVKEGDEAAVSLLVGEGGTLDDETAKKYKLKGGGDAPEVYDAVADHEAKHGGETDAEAEAKRQRMLEGQEDPDGPPVEGERDEKAAKAKANKAVQNPPANKAG